MKTTESCKSYRSILILVLMIMITGCHVGQPSKVGYLLPNMVFQRYMREKVFFTERIASLGGEAIVESANDDDKLQVQQAHDLIEHGVGLLVVDPVNLYSAAEIVRVAHEKGIKVIAYDRLICNSDLDYYLSFDNEKVGELMAT